MFTEDQIQELKELFQSEFGLEVSPEEAGQYMAQLLDLLLVTYKNDGSPP